MTRKFMIGTIAAFTVASLSHEATAVITLTHTVGGTAATYSSTAALATTVTNLSDANFIADVGMLDRVFDNAWFWRLAGDTREFQFSQVGMVEAAAGNAGSRSWANPALGGQFSAVVNYLLLDGAVAGQAIVQQTMTITNTGLSPLDISLFNYVDVDVEGAAADSANMIGTDTMNIFQNVNPALFTQFQGVGANAFQGGVFGGAPGNLLTNTLVNNLNNTGVPATNVDFAGAFQWNLLIGAGQSMSVVENITINLAVPAPGALTLLGLAGLVSSRRRRRA